MHVVVIDICHVAIEWYCRDPSRLRCPSYALPGLRQTLTALIQLVDVAIGRTSPVTQVSVAVASVRSCQSVFCCLIAPHQLLWRSKLSCSTSSLTDEARHASNIQCHLSLAHSAGVAGRHDRSIRLCDRTCSVRCRSAQAGVSLPAPRRRMGRRHHNATHRGLADALALLATRGPADELLLTMSRLASIDRLLAVLNLRSHRARSCWRMAAGLILAFACTALAVAAAVALVHFHHSDTP